ncbi:GNAT family N-acetyltransferase [Kribbella jejuensis]|uniref:N-acetylglutamate synthase-like GNAT family acetyltransferase n=1 Tax=Kribbella jejuensis TaxID=236068 RepID=A0A542ETE9_9ACTN|nr:GNAT family N-acetyltransferase [Kribbella jejuensis]TQJ18633.1 N-acetylglutamate synthase-like GNAT family acetyltransferase [Kribbella jejuensis]
MGFEIRTARPEDAVGIARVWAATMPQLVKTARAVELQLRHGRSQEVLVAVDGPDVVGYANLYLPPAARVRITVQVPPANRGRGIGTALLSAVEGRARELGAQRLLVAVADDSTGFATRRGFTIGRRMTHSAADLTVAREPLPVPEGLRLVTYAELEPVQLYDAEVQVRDDDPSGLSGGPSYDEWVETHWANPDTRYDLSIAVLDGDRVLSFVTTTADPDRGVIWSNLTGTILSARGRGLAKVVKSVALARARDAGFTVASTGNDAANEPMLAVNRWLGYVEKSGAWTAEKAL